MKSKSISLTTRRPSSSISSPTRSASQLALESSRTKISILAGQWPVNKLKKQVLHLQSRKIEDHFRKFTNRLKQDNEFVEGVVIKANSMIRLSKRTQDIKDTITTHCSLNEALKKKDVISEQDITTKSKQQKQERQAFMNKFKQLNLPKRQYDRDKLDLVISKSREKYQASKSGQNKQNINHLVSMFSNFEELCRIQRKQVHQRLSKLEQISSHIGQITGKETISVDEFLKHSRTVSRQEIDAHS